VPSKPRVHELEQQLGVESKTGLVKVNGLGTFKRSASSTVEAPVLHRSRVDGEAHVTARGATTPPAPLPPRGTRTGRLHDAPSSHSAMAQRLLQELARRDPDGSLLARTTDLRQAAVLAADRILDPALVWVAHLGAFYDTEGVRTLLGHPGTPVSRQAVHKRRGLLALTTTSSQVVFPAFQFRGQSLATGLDRVLAALPDTLVSRWTVASWLVSSDAELGGERPIDALFQGEAAVALVVRAAARWSAALAA